MVNLPFYQTGHAITEERSDAVAKNFETVSYPSTSVDLTLVSMYNMIMHGGDPNEMYRNLLYILVIVCVLYFISTTL